MGNIDVEVLWDRDKSRNTVALNELVRRSSGVLRLGTIVRMKRGKEWRRGTVVRIIKKKDGEPMDIDQDEGVDADEGAATEEGEDTEIDEGAATEDGEDTDADEGAATDEEKDTDDGEDNLPLASFGKYHVLILIFAMHFDMIINLHQPSNFVNVSFN